MNMWPRYCEMLVGLWLIASPWIFGHADGSMRQWIDIGAGCVVILLAILSFFHMTHWAHLLSGGLAVLLGGSAWLLAERPGPPWAQNEITASLVLVLFFLLPNETSQPPRPWRQA